MAQRNSSTISRLQVIPFRAVHIDEYISVLITGESYLAFLARVEIFAVISTELEVDKPQESCSCGDKNHAVLGCAVRKM